MTMTYSDIKGMVHSIGLPCAYDHFSKEDAVDPPFIVWLFPNTDPFGADDTIYFEASALNIELYTDFKSPTHEQQVEAVLKQYGIFYEKSEVWIASERMYEVLYQMEVAYVNNTNDQ